MEHRKTIDLVSPLVIDTDKSEAELFGAMVWLWMHSSDHRRCPLADLERLLLPAIQTGQFVLALESTPVQRPVGLMTWAWFTAETEQRYLQCLDRTLQPQEWTQGDRPWILDLLAPFGHAHQLVRQTRDLLARSCFRTLYHRGDQSGLRVMHLRGSALNDADESAFWRARPLSGGGWQ